MLTTEKQKGEADATKLFESEETLMKAREEIENLKTELLSAKGNSGKIQLNLQLTLNLKHSIF